jgi:hypothetical protein
MLASHMVASGASAGVSPALRSQLVHKLETPLLAVVFLAVLLSGKLKPSTCNWSFAATAFFWIWSTIVWANDVEILEQRLLSTPLPLSRSFWLAFIPHTVMAIVAMIVSPKQFLSFGFGSGSSGDTSAWYAAGLGLFFGQLLCNAALSASSPIVTFVIRAIEPIVIAKLAMSALGKTSTLQQLFPIFFSCSGVMLSVMGCDRFTQNDRDFNNIEVACLLAMVSNLGFAVRSCSVKFAYTTEGQQICPMEVFVKLSKTSAAASLIPLVLYVIYAGRDVSGFTSLISALKGCWMPMLSMSLCSALSMAASFLMLSAVAVESHALMNALKQVLLALLESVLMGEQLSMPTLAGVFITVLGISLYAAAPIQLEAQLPHKSEPCEADQLLPASHKQDKGYHGIPLPNSLVICGVLVAIAGVRCSFGEVGSFKAPANFS